MFRQRAGRCGMDGPRREEMACLGGRKSVLRESMKGGYEH